MKYRLNYSHSTTNCHVYVVESTDKRKHGKRVWLPRYNDPEHPFIHTEMYIDDDAVPQNAKGNRTRVRYTPTDSGI